MKRSAIVLASLLSMVLLAYLPLVPSAIFFRFAPLAFQSSANHSSLDGDKVSDALIPVFENKKYGEMYGLPRTLSIYQYLREYRIGILSVKDASTADRDVCATCSLVVDAGFSCGGFCGGGTIFYLALVNGKWKVEKYATWAS